MALYAHREAPWAVGRVGAVSPTLSWCDGHTWQHWDRRLAGWTKLWLDAGSEERIWVDDVFLDYAGLAEGFYHHLRHLGYQPWEVNLFLDPGASHHETAWNRRFPMLLEWLLN